MLYLRLKKRKTFFLEKNLKFSKKKFSFEKCRVAPKNVKGGPFLIYKHAFCSKITKNSKGGPFGDNKKISKKKSHSAKKIKRGDPLASAGFVGYVEKVKNERGDPLEAKKFSKKKSHSAEKKRKKSSEGGTL